MAKDNSHIWQLNDLSPNDDFFPEVEDKSEVPYGSIKTGKDEEYCPLTPEQKLGLQKNGSTDHNLEAYLSSDGISSDLSTEKGSETMSSSSASSTESCRYKLPVKGYLLQARVTEPEDDNIGDKENLQVANEVDKECIHKEVRNLLLQELLEKVANYELDLKFAKKNLEFSEAEVARLKYENLTLAEELGRTTEKLQTSEDKVERMEHKLRNKSHEDHNQLQDHLHLANQSIVMLQAELASEGRLVTELQQVISKATNDISDYDREMDELKLALRDAQEDFFRDKLQFQSDINHLQKEKNAISTRLKEAELRNKLLEEQIQPYEVENVKIKSLHEAQKTGFLDEIRQLKAELSKKCELVDSLNKNLGASKLKYDRLMTEKNELFAKVQKLGAEVNCQDINIQQMEDCICQLTVEREEMLLELEKAQEMVEELRMKVKDQQEELERQKAVICDRAEEKREAIRQLCFSLEHYRSGYHDLRQAFIKYNHSTVLAS